MIQALGDLAADANRGRVLQVNLHAGEAVELGPQVFDQAFDAERALIARLQVNHQLAVIRAAQAGRRGAADAGHERSHIRILRNRPGDLLDILHHLVIRSALRGFGDHGQLIGVLVGDEALGNLHEHVHRGRQHDHETGHHQGLMAQRDLQRDVVDAQHPVKEFFRDVIEPAALHVVRRGLQETAAQHRGERDRDHTRNQDGHRDGDGELLEQPAQNATQEQHRDEYGRERERHGHNRESDFTRPFERSHQRRLAHLDMPDDVLQHDDGIVHHEADGKDQGHHGQVVQAVVQQVHHGEGSDDGERQRQAGDDGRRHVAQKQEDHHHHQAQRQRHGELHVVIAFADGVRTVVENVHAYRRRQFLLEQRQQVLHAVRHRDGIGAGLALDGQDDGAAIEFAGVIPGRGFVVLHRIDNGAQLLQAHGRSAAIGHHHTPVLVGRQQLPGGLQSEGALRPDDGTGGQVHVPVLERGFNFVDADLPRG